jgi:sugar transferase (PEP-CTERM/EpsH1 system associated)
MRVAYFTPSLPYPPDTGGKIRSYHMLRALAERFEVDLYTVYHRDRPSESSISELERDCHRVTLFKLRKSWRTRDRIWRILKPLPKQVDHFHTDGSLAQARRYLEGEGYDLIAVDELCMTPYAELVARIPRIVGRQKVDHVHYREVAVARSWGLEKVLDFTEAYKLRRYQQVKMPLYQAFLACSEQDARGIQTDAPDARCLVIPNGVDLRRHVPASEQQPQAASLLYVGSMDYYPNVDAMKFFFECMHNSIRERIPDIRLRIVGHSPPPEIRRLAEIPGVEVTGSVQDVRSYYEQAALFIVPLRLGGGTRLKILEAMAMGTPVVSTSVGAQGLNYRPGVDILIADDAQSFSDSVVQALSDPGLRSQLAREGRRLALRYDWMEIMKPLAELAVEVVRDWNWEKD